MAGWLPDWMSLAGCVGQTVSPLRSERPSAAGQGRPALTLVCPTEPETANSQNDGPRPEPVRAAGARPKEDGS